MLTRRLFVIGGLAAPAIIRATSLMPVKVWRPPLIIKDGWVVPNGAEVSRLAFPDLFAVLGTTCGSRSSTTFTLPVVPQQLMKTDGALAGMLRCFLYNNPVLRSDIGWCDVVVDSGHLVL